MTNIYKNCQCGLPTCCFCEAKKTGQSTPCNQSPTNFPDMVALPSMPVVFHAEVPKEVPKAEKPKKDLKVKQVSQPLKLPINNPIPRKSCCGGKKHQQELLKRMNEQVRIATQYRRDESR